MMESRVCFLCQRRRVKVHKGFWRKPAPGCAPVGWPEDNQACWAFCRRHPGTTVEERANARSSPFGKLAKKKASKRAPPTLSLSEEVNINICCDSRVFRWNEATEDTVRLLPCQGFEDDPWLTLDQETCWQETFAAIPTPTILDTWDALVHSF
jgi:hypothetical protein